MLHVYKRWWKQYRHRFLPWIMFSFIRRVPRYTSTNHKQSRVIADVDIVADLQRTFSAFDTACRLDTPPVNRRAYAEASCDSHGLTAESAAAELRSESVHGRNVDVMLQSCGFTVERRASTLKHAGTGVLVTDGTVPAGVVTSLYPGVVYLPGEPVLLQSVGNSFVLRCVDGLYIDGNDRRISAAIYRSCSRRDAAVYGLHYDTSWLTQFPLNPLAVGQYVNGCTRDRPANVAYQELDLPADFVQQFHRYIPNVYFSSADDHATRTLRTVALVSLRDISLGEELLSNYFTIDASQ